jgi:hypothetical protein
MSASSWVSSRDGSLRAFPTVNPLVTDANDDWSPEGFEPETSPARKFVAGPDWIAVGDLVLQPGDQIEAHLDLDSRASAAVADGSLTAGFLYGDSERVHLKAFPGSAVDRAGAPASLTLGLARKASRSTSRRRKGRAAFFNRTRSRTVTCGRSRSTTRASPDSTALLERASALVRRCAKKLSPRKTTKFLTR